MGAESFFFNIICERINVKQSILERLDKIREINQYYAYSSALFFKRKLMDDNRYTYGKALVLDIVTNSDVTIISVEACFANYRCNMKLSYELYAEIKSTYNNVFLKFGDSITDIPISIKSAEVFDTWLSSTHKEKYEAFVDRYGELNINILPSEFYEYIKKRFKR